MGQNTDAHSVPKRPIFKGFWDFPWARTRHHGPKTAKNTCLGIPNGQGSLLEKHVFDPFLIHFWSHNGPFSRHFGIFHGPKHVTMAKHLFEHPKWSRNNFGKVISFAPGTPVDPPLAPTVRGLCCPPAAPSDHWYGGRHVSLGDSETWEPQKLGGCGWTRCPQNLLLSHVAQDTARSWFRACSTQMAHT